MGKLSRTKGANFEREIAKYFQDMGWSKARRKLSQYQETDGCDLENVEPFVVQCKSGKKINVLIAFKEALGSSKKGEIPMAVVKWDRNKPLFVLDQEGITRLLNAWTDYHH